jgi:hypothetical protein
MADKDLSALIAELGGDKPHNRAIAEGLQKQGIASTKDIGVRQIPEMQTVDVNIPDGSDAGWHTESQTVPTGNQTQEFFNKATGSTINPGRLGIIQNGTGGLQGGDIFFHLRSDDNGNISFEPQWSPRAHGFLRDNPLGQMIMAVGKIIPVTAPYFLAASAIDAAAHGNYGAAIANLVPMGLQQLAAGTDVLSQIAGPDFNPVSVTPGGQIAEALGVPVQVADQVGKAATSALKAGLSGKDAGEALLQSGIGSLVGTGASYLKEAGGELLNDVKGGITTLFGESASDATEGIPGAGSLITQLASPPNPGETDFNYENQQGINTGASFQGDGFGNIGEGEFADEIKAPVDLTARDNIEPEQGIVSLNNEELANNPFKAVDDSGIAEDTPKFTPVYKSEVDVNAPKEDLTFDTRSDENGLGNDLAVDTRADENGIGSLNNQTTNALEDKDAKGLQSLYEQENPGAANVDVETANTVRIDGKEYFLDDQGGAATQNPDGSYTHLNAREFNDLGSPDEVDSDGTLDTVTVTGGNGVDSVSPVAYDDEGNLMPGYELDSEGNAVWMGGGSNYVTPEGEGMVDDGGTSTVGEGGTAYIDPYEPLQLPPGAGPDEPEPEEPYLLNPDEPSVEPEEPPAESKEPSKDVDDTGLLPKVPAIFPPKPKTPVLKPVTPKPTVKSDDGGLDDIIKGLVGGTVVGKAIDGLKEPAATPATPADSLKGNYSFSWNPQQTKAAEKGVAYGQKYFGNHWNQPEKNQPEKMVAITSDPFPSDPSIYEDFGARPTQYGAEGGLMALDKTTLNPTFKPTMTDSGIQASDITKQDIVGQAIQHMRRGGHVIDHKTHKDVHYLASKGEPVHHIVGFMNHRKRMAEGGITSHSLGSYSDGGHLLKGPGDGMSDDIPATIADKQPARLANEEFVIPADVVSHLGNGSSESGAKVLYEMMSRIRKARTGNPKQGKQIDPHKLLPKV